MFPQIALAIGVLSSSIGVRVRRFCGFVFGGACRAVCRLRCLVMCMGDGSQIQGGLLGRVSS